MRRVAVDGVGRTIFLEFMLRSRVGSKVRPTNQGAHMNKRWILTAALTASLAGCATHGGRSEEAAEAGETKVQLAQTPDAVRKTIERELSGGQLEDISRKQREGKTVYETDIIRNDGKWE